VVVVVVFIVLVVVVVVDKRVVRNDLPIFFILTTEHTADMDFDIYLSMET